MNYPASSGGGGMPAAGDGEVYSLKWQTFHSHFTDGLKSLFLETDPLTDVTLASEGRYIRSHKLILSLCSPYFKHMFQVNQCPNGNMIVVLNNVKYTDLENLIHFIYNGEVKVKNTDLNGFLQTGEFLQIEGLANCATNDNENAESSTGQDQAQNNVQNLESLNSVNNDSQRAANFVANQQNMHSNSLPSIPVRVQMSSTSSSNSFPSRVYPHHKSAQRSVKRAKYTVQSTGRSLPPNSVEGSMSGSNYNTSVSMTGVEMEGDPLAMHQTPGPQDSQSLGEEINPLLEDPLADHMIQIHPRIKNEDNQEYVNENPDEFEPTDNVCITEVDVGDIFTNSLSINDGVNNSLPGPSSAVTGRAGGSGGAVSKSPVLDGKVVFPRPTNRGGRPIGSTVWDTFTYDREVNKSTCNLCGYRLSGRNTTNLRNHLRFKHQVER